MDLKDQDFGEIFSSGLRKGLDSDWSALAMHTVKLMPPEVWTSYCRWAGKKAESWRQHPTLEQVADLFTLPDWHPPQGSAVMVWKLLLRQAAVIDARGMRAWIDYGVNGDPAVSAGNGEKEMTPKPLCVGCNKHPDQIAEYSAEYIKDVMGQEVSADDFVRAEEGTFNRENGHFLCTDCYIDAGMPSSGRGWVAP